jgi:hypothetical protein
MFVVSDLADCGLQEARNDVRLIKELCPGQGSVGSEALGRRGFDHEGTHGQGDAQPATLRVNYQGQ